MTENNSFLIPGGGFHAFWFGYGCGKELSNKYETAQLYGYSAGAMAAEYLFLKLAYIFGYNIAI
jgi:hypothetical protein